MNVSDSELLRDDEATRQRRRSLELATFALTLSAVLLSGDVAHAYRSAGDYAWADGTTRVRWSTPTVNFRMASTGAPGVTLSAAELAITNGLATWAAPPCTDMRLDYVGAGGSAVFGDGLNTIEWHTLEWSTAGFPANVAGYTDIVYEKSLSGEWVIVEADIHLNAVDFGWTTSDVAASGMRRVDVVLTHELGHALGLLHPCEPDGSDGAPRCDSNASFVEETMYPLYVGASQLDLAADDIAGICFLYPSIPCEPACGDGTTCLHGSCVPLCGGVVCADAEICSNQSCVQRCGAVACVPFVPCSNDDQCGAGFQCADGVCIDERGTIGDPCSQPSDCSTASCSPDGYCTESCAGGCHMPLTCDTDASICVTDLGVFGDPCSSGADCLSTRCLTEGALSYCTRLCTGADTCPPGYRCDQVDRMPVCRIPDSASCAASMWRPHRASAPRTLSLSLAVALAIGFRSWKRRIR